MSNTPPCVLSIAGFDPSGGAGILADVKTMEQNGVYAFGAVSALTTQNDREFFSVDWVEDDKIIDQIEVLFRRFLFRHVKIGLIRNVDSLRKILYYLHLCVKDPVIVFDPVLQASAGFIFHKPDNSGFANTNILEKIYCITPNLPEANSIFGKDNLRQNMLDASHICNIYLKGGHGDSDLVTDTLFTKGETYGLTAKKIEHGGKHGSGCVLSSAFTAQLALGNTINLAAEKAFNYTNKFLASNKTLLGTHKNIL